MNSILTYFKSNNDKILDKYNELLELKDEISKEFELNDLESLFLICTILLLKIENIEDSFKIPNSVSNIDQDNSDIYLS